MGQSRRLVDVGDADRQGLLERPAAAVRGAHTHRVGIFDFEVEDAAVFRFATRDGEAGVVRVTRTRHEGVGEGVARVRASVEDSDPTVVPEAAFSATVLAERLRARGCVVGVVTLIVKASSKLAPPASVARTRQRSRSFLTSK